MLKLDYPKGLNLKYFKKKYHEKFDIEAMNKSFQNFTKNKKFNSISKYEVRDILTLDFEDLIELNEKFMSCQPSEKDIKNVSRIFNYDSSFTNPIEKKYQSSIASFFIENKSTLRINTCYFCNIEDVSSFIDAADYMDYNELLKFAPKEDLMSIKDIGDIASNRIKELQKDNTVTDILHQLANMPSPLQEPQIDNLKSMNFNSERHYFTLDHVLSKAKNPLSALSIFNLVPCCYPCNSKFKTTKQLVNNQNNSFLSPTSKYFSFSKDNIFKLYLSPEVKSPTLIAGVNNFSVRLKSSREKFEYERFSQIFKLNARYKEYKDEVLDLIKKGRNYTPKKLERMSEILGVSVEEVKNDIFGKHIFTDSYSEVSKSKFLADIAKQVNIK